MSNYNPRVSIGLCVYNGEQFLEKTLDALLTQTYPDFELIIADNASTDQTSVICQVYAAQDRRIRYYRNAENLGLALNYNRAFKLSKGEYFKWATADDLCKPAYLARCVEILDSEPAVVLAYPKTQFIDESERLLDVTDPGWDLRSEAADERMRYVLHAGHWVNAIVGLIRANALVKTRLMQRYPGADYTLLGELSLLGKFFEIPEYLFLRRLHSKASSQNTTNLQWLVEYYTARSEHVCLPFWCRYFDHCSTILRSELYLGQKLSLVYTLLRQMRWGRSRLQEELRIACKWYIRRVLVHSLALFRDCR
jgi:glycosyltransferase involved in cell wall biosynthesis